MFKKPNNDKIAEFLNESDEQLAYRLQNEEFYAQNKNSKKRSNNNNNNLKKESEVRQNEGRNSKSSNASQEDADFLLAQKLQKEEEEMYQNHLEKQKKKKEEKRIKRKTPEISPREGPNPLFSHHNNKINNMGFDHGPSTSTKIPGKEAQKSHQIQDAYLANKLNRQINSVQEKPLETICPTRSIEKRPLDLPLIPSVTPEINQPGASGSNYNKNDEEDELLALKLHRQEVIEANKHIKSDKNQLIKRIQEDRLNERNRRQNNKVNNIIEPCASPSAVSPVDEKNFKFPGDKKKVTKSRVVKYN